MSQPFPRRTALKSLGVSGALIGLSADEIAAQDAVAASNGNEGQSNHSVPVVNWSDTHDRIWLAGNCWANPMEDWRIVDGAAECQTTGGDRNVHLITHQLTDANAGFETSVVVSRVAVGKTSDSVGFKVGVKSDINEYRSNSFAKSGVKIGLLDGEMIVGRASQKIEGIDDVQGQDLLLHLKGAPSKGKYKLTLAVFDDSGNQLGELAATVPERGRHL